LVACGSWAAADRWLPAVEPRRARAGLSHSKLVVMRLGRRRGLALSDQALDFIVFVARKNAEHGHHAHHAGGPVGGKAVVFGLVDGGVHGHLHEGVLGKAGDGVSVLCDKGMMDMLDADRARECFHLAEGARVGRVGGLNLPIAQQVHHAVHHVVRQMAVNHPRAGILGFELDDFGLGDADENGVGGIPGGFR